MAREERNDPAVIHSSIALLQERFRQLQRVKEMREERELLRLLSDPKKLNFNTNCCMLYYDPAAVARFFFHPELMVTMLPTTRTPPQTSLSLWPTSQSQRKLADDDDDDDKIPLPPLMNLWPADTHNISDSSTSIVNKLDHDSESDSDIDTSLHL